MRLLSDSKWSIKDGTDSAEPGADKHAALFERMKLLAQTIKTSSVSTLMLASIVAYSVDSSLGHAHIPLMLWIAALAASFVLRFLFSRTFVKPSALDVRQMVIRARCLQFSSILTGWVWSFGLIAILTSDVGISVSLATLVCFMAVGFAVGAMLALSVDPPTMMLNALPSVVPMVLGVIGMQLESQTPALFATALFVLYIFLTALRNGRTLQQNSELKLKALDDERRFKEILNQSPIAACIVGATDDVQLFRNERYSELVEPYTSRVNAIGSLTGLDRYEEILSALEKGSLVSEQLIELSNPEINSGSGKWVLASFLPFKYLGQPAVLCWYYDITDRKKMEEEIQHLAHHDPLTQLPNRALFEDRLNNGLHRAERERTKLALMFIDLDGFKQVNDSLGHSTGDELLVAVAKRISTLLRASDTVARMGGDEFTVLTSVDQVQDGVAVAQKIRSELEKPFEIEGHTLNISCSLGLVVYPEHGDTAEQLMKKADTAMYQAKSEGKNKVICP